MKIVAELFKAWQIEMVGLTAKFRVGMIGCTRPQETQAVLVEIKTHR